MMIEPSDTKCGEAINDELTIKAKKLETMLMPIHCYRGTHKTLCGIRSSNRDYICPNGMITNSLMVHYVEFHRDKVPESEIKKLKNMDLNKTNKKVSSPTKKFRGFGNHKRIK